MGERSGQVSADTFIFTILLIVNALMALAMMLAARTLGQPKTAYILAGAFGGNVLLYIADGIYFFLFRGNLALNLLVSAIAMTPPILAATAYRLRSGLPLYLGRIAACHLAATGLILWFSYVDPNRGYRSAIVPLFAASVLIFGTTGLLRTGRRLRLGERPIIITSYALAAIEIGGGLVLAAMRNKPTPALEQAYTTIVFLGLPGLTVAAGIFSLYLLAGDLAERLRIAADTDSLTGAPNRRAIEMTGARMMDEARTAGHPLTIAICDVDRFKEINDLHGHGHGDEVLCRLTGLFRGQLAETEDYGRFGGEEFILFFPGSDLEQARSRVEALRKRIMEIRLEDLPLRLTASFGVAGMSLTDHSLADIIRRADRALYASKEAGRNRTTVDRQAPGVG
jgi:diguanylate cyclase (GGDEF)-like protein